MDNKKMRGINNKGRPGAKNFNPKLTTKLREYLEQGRHPTKEEVNELCQEFDATPAQVRQKSHNMKRRPEKVKAEAGTPVKTEPSGMSGGQELMRTPDRPKVKEEELECHEQMDDDSPINREEIRKPLSNSAELAAASYSHSNSGAGATPASHLAQQPSSAIEMEASPPPPNDESNRGGGGGDGTIAVRRPMNAFLIFCERHRTLVRKKHPHLDNRSVTRILEELWANLPGDVKFTYTNLAKQYKDAFIEANPDYTWYNLEKTRPPSPQTTVDTKKPLDNVLKFEDQGINPGKLADPNNMGSGLSRLLMASNLEAERRQQEAPPPAVPEYKRKTVSSLLQLAEKHKEQKPVSSLQQLAEMCSSRIETSTEAKPSIDIKPAIPTSSVAAAPATSSSVGMTPRWTPKYEPHFSPKAEPTSSESEEPLPKYKKAMKTHNQQKAKAQGAKTQKGNKNQKTSPNSEYKLSDLPKVSIESYAKIICKELMEDFNKIKLGSQHMPASSTSHSKPSNQIQDNNAPNGNLVFKTKAAPGLSKMGVVEVPLDVGGVPAAAAAEPPKKIFSIVAMTAAHVLSSTSLTNKHAASSSHSNSGASATPASHLAQQPSSAIGAGGVMPLKKRRKVNLSRGMEDIHNYGRKLGGMEANMSSIIGEEQQSSKQKSSKKKYTQQGATNIDDLYMKMQKRSQSSSNIKTKAEEKPPPKLQWQRHSSYSDNSNNQAEPSEEENSREGVRKSSRRNKGNLYQELVSQGFIQSARGLKQQRLSEGSHSDDSMDNDFHLSSDAVFAPSLPLPPTPLTTAPAPATRRCTVFENSLHGDEADAVRYKTGDFDLDEKSKSLPAVTIENVTNSQAQNLSMGQRVFMAKQPPSSATSFSTSALSTTSESVAPPNVSAPPLTGSAKRKVRRKAITRLVVMPGVPGSSSLVKLPSSEASPSLTPVSHPISVSTATTTTTTNTDQTSPSISEAGSEKENKDYSKNDSCSSNVVSSMDASQDPTDCVEVMQMATDRRLSQ